MINVAVDAMGGDNAPGEIVRGALLAALNLNGIVSLVGNQDQIQPFLPRQLPNNVKIIHASETIEMHEKPVEALRRKKDSSLVRCVQLVKDGTADVVVSAGNTGAVAAASLITWKQIQGVHRPAIASIFPSHHGRFLLLDAGASPDVDPIHLHEFARMGRIYAQRVMDRPNPRVHLLNIGEEPGKGNQFAKDTYQLLVNEPWFAGNIEGKDMFKIPVDVIVCDAFVGNIVLKTAEGVAEFIMASIRDQVPKNKLLQLQYLPMKKLLRPLRKLVDYAEYGGSPLLGLNGLSYICHGRSDAKAIKNAILVAHHAASNQLLQTLQTDFQNT